MLQELELTQAVLEEVKQRNATQVPLSYARFAQLWYAFMDLEVGVNYTVYKEACNFAYCDYVQRKSVVDRIVEFFSTVGGLWTFIIGVAMLLWSACGQTGLIGPTNSGFYVLHEA